MCFPSSERRTYQYRTSTPEVAIDRPPYQRIADEIGARITSGRLSPGDHVPSTRQITRDFGVAMTTATRAIATLRAAGLVETRPGAGTVVRRVVHAGEPTRELDRDRVVTAAIRVADNEGIAAVSMRRVAADLGVATMSLYRHVSGKDDLLVQMADLVAAEEIAPAEPPTPWRPRLEFAARLLWTVCRRHPWVAEILSLTRPQPMPNVLTYSEWVLTALHELGLDANESMYVHLTLFNHVRGIATALQAEAADQENTGLTSDEWMDTRITAFFDLVTTGRYPAMERLTEEGFDQNLDALFEVGLRLILDGLDRRVR